MFWWFVVRMFVCYVVFFVDKHVGIAQYLIIYVIWRFVFLFSFFCPSNVCWLSEFLHLTCLLIVWNLMWGNYVDRLFYRTSCQYRMSQVGSADVNNECAVIVFSAFVGFHMTSFQSCDFADPQVRTAMSSRFPTKLNFRDDSWHSNCLSKQHVFLIAGKVRVSQITA